MPALRELAKSFLAEKAAEAISYAEGKEIPFVRFDMSEYCDKESSLEFIGSDGVYKGSKSGNFTSFVKKNPRCLILLDEVEKAHISIIHLFLQILDAGRIRDSKTDEEVSLASAIMVLRPMRANSFTKTPSRLFFGFTAQSNFKGIAKGR